MPPFPTRRCCSCWPDRLICACGAQWCESCRISRCPAYLQRRLALWRRRYNHAAAAGPYVAAVAVAGLVAYLVAS